MKKKVNIITMGCSKNLVDSEMLLTQLDKNDFEVVHDADGDGFDAVIINTCGFIHDAKEESVNTILDYVHAREQNRIGKIYVMGCLSERYQQELEKEIPEVDQYFGKFDLKALISELKATFKPEYIYERKITTPSHFAYLKISEGCNRSCAFCAIPSMTGQHQSKPMEDLVKEAIYLARNGVKELLVIAQDLSYYGIDLYGKNQLAELITALSEIKGIEWIRLHYLYPTRFPYAILPIMRDHPKVCKYMDIPLQHVSTSVLKNMLRHVTAEETQQLINRIRHEVPGVVLRTTFLLGFPGETASDFEALKAFVRQARFDKLGCFAYSHEEGTYAYKRFQDDVPEEIKQQRVEELMELQRHISAEINHARIGSVQKVIIDRKEEDFYVGRTEFDSPEVDGEVFITSDTKLLLGAFYQVKITGAEEYDLYGTIHPSD